MATHSLLMIGKPAKAVLPALMLALKDQDGYVRLYAVYAVGEIGPDAKAAIPVLSQGVKTGSLGAEAILAIAEMGTDSVPVLMDFLADKDERVRLAAVKGLGLNGVGAKAALPKLRNLITTVEGLIKVHTALSLWQIDSDKAVALETLDWGAKQLDAETRVGAIKAIGQMGVVAAEKEKLLKSLMHDQSAEVRAAAALALYRVTKMPQESAFEKRC
jgi:HEAT repeat protein